MPPGLVQARLDEAQHLAWLRDVKAMMASGAEDGLAMALAQTMEESHRKGNLLKQKDAELRALRVRPAGAVDGAPASRAAPPASGRVKPPPLLTAAARSASTTSTTSSSPASASPSSSRAASSRSIPVAASGRSISNNRLR